MIADPATMSFEEAVVSSEELLNDIEKNGVNEARAGKIAAYLSSMNSARGFFVSFLTGSFTIADQPPVRFVELVRSGGEHLSDLLAKNLVMSSTMRVAHARKNEKEDADGSAMVAQRTGNVIMLARDERIKSRLEDMKQALLTKQGPYAEFVGRFPYDEEQVAAALQGIDNILTRWAS